MTFEAALASAADNTTRTTNSATRPVAEVSVVPLIVQLDAERLAPHRLVFGPGVSMLRSSSMYTYVCMTLITHTCT